jgi:tetratricopeptide (TPR) repeat protein
VKVAALQAWFGQKQEHAETCGRALELARGTSDPLTAYYVSSMCCLRPTQDTAQLEAALALARKAVELGKNHVSLPYFQTTLGMAEYRSGHFAEADAALLAATKAGPNNPQVTGISGFYRAMSLFRQGKLGDADEARKLAIMTAAKMKPLPKDEANPLVDNASPNDLILWLAYKEALTLLKIELSPIELLEQARDDEVKTLGADHPSTLALTHKLVEAYVTSGRTREAVPLLATESAANPKDTILSMKVAALQAWFGQEKELAATRQQILASAKGSSEVFRAERAAKVCSMAPPTDKAELEAALTLGRTAVEAGKGGEWNLLALGMAEYRSGNDTAAEKALLGAEKASPKNRYVTGTSAFYRAMSLFRQEKLDEARKLATEATAQMKPLPTDEQNPLAGNAGHDDLILWLAYKEAKALIKFDATPPTKAENDKK